MYLSSRILGDSIRDIILSESRDSYRHDSCFITIYRKTLNNRWNSYKTKQNKTKASLWELVAGINDQLYHLIPPCGVISSFGCPVLAGAAKAAICTDYTDNTRSDTATLIPPGKNRSTRVSMCYTSVHLCRVVSCASLLPLGRGRNKQDKGE